MAFVTMTWDIASLVLSDVCSLAVVGVIGNTAFVAECGD